MIDLILIGNQGNGEIADCLNENFNIIAGVVDCYSPHQTMQENYLKNKNIKIVSFEEAMKIKTDYYFIISYYKIIPQKYIIKNKIMNLHGGILPKYRGMSSNLLAILNDEKELGYTLHFIDDGMDSGDIISIFKIQNDLNLMAEELLFKIKQKVIQELPKKIKEFANGKIKLLSQKNKKFIYSSRLFAKDGEILNWNQNSLDLYHLFRIFGGKNGSGFYCFFKGEKYKIGKVILPKQCLNFKGIPSSVIFSGGGGDFWIKTLDNALILQNVFHVKTSQTLPALIGMRLDSK